MGYLDYAGLQYLWGKLKEKFAPKSHSHDDRYYTEAEMDGKLNSKSNTNHTHDASTLINALGTGAAAPTDPDYIITQWVGGGISNTTWVRRPMSSIWNYIKGKADGVYQPKGSYAASGHTHDDRYYTEAELNSKLAAKAENIVLAYNTNLDNVTTPGFYSCGGGNSISNKPTGTDAIGLIVTHNASGNYYTQILTTSSNANTYRRTCLNGSWSGWTQDKYTDTNTWRGIQNNLTSDSTSDSLSAAQGKALKGLVDGKAPNGHTHNSIKDIGDNGTLTFAYSKAGLNYGSYSWLAGWNGKELRAVSKDQFATAEHTHSSIVGHTAGNGFNFGYSNSKDVTIPKETAVSTYYVKILSSTPFDFRFKKMYVKTVGDNTQYSFIAQISANAYMQPHIELITQQYNSTEIKNIIVASAPNYYHSIYLEIDSSTKVAKTISIQTDFSTDASLSLSKTKPSDVQLTVPIRSNSHISTSIPIYADGGIWGNLNGKATSAGTADVANSVDWSKVQNKPTTYVPAAHTHDDRYYTETEINSKLDGKSNTGHTHDDRYYTESEINTKLNGKANSSHTHTKSQIIDFPASLKNPTALTIQTNGITSAIYDGSAAKTVNITKGNIGLGNVDNTADANKSVKYATSAGNANTATKATTADSATTATTSTLVKHQGSVPAISGTDTRTAGMQLYGAYNNGYPMTYGNVICASNGSFGSEIALDCVGGDGKRGPGRMYYRNRSDWGTSEWSDWATVAYLTDKVAGANHADSATTSNGVKDYNDANRTIKIGFAGDGLNTSNLNYIAGYTDNGTKIKDVSKDVLKSWIGLGNYLPLIGGTMSGQITKSTGGSWIGDRDRAAIKSSYAGDSSYGAVAAMATKNGYWTMGNLGGNESLIFNYSTDAKYNAGKNETSQVYLPAQAGTIITSATVGSQSVNYANSAGTANVANSVDWSKVQNKPSSYAPTSHTHDDRYYTESEVNTKLANYQPKGNYAAASHTHNYAGSGSAGGSANSAIKLDSSAGSATQPVYFKDGKPVVTTYALNKTVPADAKFTDTNTWRGIQNNLTSDSTDQSLSAAQGKALKTLVDGKAPTSHKHTKSQITDFPTSMPASDVSAWAKAATKPSYTKAEVGLSNVDNTADKDKSVKYAASAGSASQLNGFTIQASTSDLTAGSSKLSNNVIYIVYE